MRSCGWKDWALLGWLVLAAPAWARPVTPQDLVESVEIHPVVASSRGDIAFAVVHPFPSGNANRIVNKFGECELWAGRPGQAARRLGSGGIQMAYSPNGEYLAALVPDQLGCAVGLWSQRDGAYRELGRVNEDFSDSHQQIFAWTTDGLLLYQRAMGPDTKANPQVLDSRDTRAHARMELLAYHPESGQGQILDQGHHFESLVPAGQGNLVAWVRPEAYPAPTGDFGYYSCSSRMTIYDRTTQARREVVFPPNGRKADLGFAWSGSGSTLCVDAADGLHIYGPSGGERDLTGAHRPVWLGESLCYGQGDGWVDEGHPEGPILHLYPCEWGAVAVGAKELTLYFQDRPPLPVEVPGEGAVSVKPLGNAVLVSRGGLGYELSSDASLRAVTYEGQLVALSPQGAVALTPNSLRRGKDLLWAGNAHWKDMQVGRPTLLRGSNDLAHWLILPPAELAVPPGGYPVVVWIYPGDTYRDAVPREARLEMGTLNHMMIGPWLARGYAVFLPTVEVGLRGLHEPAAEIVENLGKALEVLRQSKEVDMDRLVVAGQSFGGYATLIAASSELPFRCAISFDGVADLAMFYLTFKQHVADWDQEEITQEQIIYFGWGEKGQANLGATPWSDPARYARNSAVYRVEKVKHPLLLIAGKRDGLEAEEMFSALYRLGRPVRMLRFFDEVHYVVRRDNFLRQWREIYDWLEVNNPPRS